MIPQFRKFDNEKQKVLLNKEYLFAYSADDGFSERLLHEEIIIDFEYRCIVKVRAFNKMPFYRELETIPEPISSYMEQLLNSDYNSLKSYYDYITFGIDDIGGSQLLINIDIETMETGVLNGLPNSYFETPVDKLLYAFNMYMREFFVKIYNKEMLQ